MIRDLQSHQFGVAVFVYKWDNKSYEKEINSRDTFGFNLSWVIWLC